jgi:glycosyltransferase involved in cell wall biosynthesis
VITSNTSSMPEVAGNGALIIDPFRPEEITSGIIQIINNQSMREELIKNGFEQAAKFSWKAMAESVLKIYQEIGPINKRK